MQIFSQLVNLIKNLTGTRNLILLLFMLLIGAVLLFQYFQKQETRRQPENAGQGMLDAIYIPMLGSAKNSNIA